MIAVHTPHASPQRTTLRRKVLAVVGATLLVLIGVLYWLSSRILLGGFARVEERDARASVSRVIDAFDDDAAKLDTVTSDWAGWDDTYNFIQKNSAAYRKGNLNNETLSDLKLRLIAYVKPDGTVYFGSGFDLRDNRKTPLPQGFTTYLNPHGVLLRAALSMVHAPPHEKINRSTKGLILLPQGAVIVAARPILKSDKSGPARGALVQGRGLDEAEVGRLARLTQFPLQVLPFDNKNLPPDFAAVRDELKTKAGSSHSDAIAIRAINRNQLAGFAALRDVSGQPILILRVEMNRAIFHQGQRSLRYFLLALLSVGAVFGLLASVLLERLVLKRVTRLSTDVNHIRVSGSATRRVESSGADELALLSDDINAMLAALNSAQNKVLESEVRLASIVETNADGILIVNTDGKITLANAAAERIFGMPRADLTQQFYGAAAWKIEAIDGSDFLAEALPHARALQTGVPVYGVEHAIHQPSGARVVVSINAAPLRDATGKATGAVLSITDFTQKKILEERLRRLAYHDPLTGLCNRTLFLDRLEHSWSRARRTQNGLAVLFIDLDNFKFVNDSLGHAAGDELLVAVAGRIKSCLRESDTAARLGGDEFTILLDDIHKTGDALPVAERVLKALLDPFVLGEREVFTTPSIGIAISVASVARGAESTAGDLLRFADAAMYEAKTKGKARYEIYDASMGQGALQRLELESALRRALDRDEFVLHYQPQIDLKSGKIHGAEALLRWAHPTHGLVPPLDFIPLCEETGLILPVGRWVLEAACREARAWQEEYSSRGAQELLLEEFFISVNLSVRQLRDENLVAHVAQALRDSGLEARHLILEITENVMMENPDANIATLQALKNLGVRLAIDDFGTGFSSLAYLKNFPIDILKIDRKLVAGLQSGDSSGLTILEETINLAHALNLQVVAEGAETEDEVALLKQLGSDVAQGYYFSRPVPAKEFAEFVRQKRA